MSARTATTSLTRWARRHARPDIAVPSEATLFASSSCTQPRALRCFSSSSQTARPRPSPSPSTSLSTAPMSSSAPSQILRGPSAQPLGANLSSQDILSHFSRPPFPSANLLGNDAELAKRTMTHESFMYAKDGHNRRLAFIGRRSLKMFVTLFLHSCLNAPALSSDARSYTLRLLESSDLDDVLHTSRLGDKVGRDLELEKVMRWTPAVTDGQRGPLETGLFKIRGVCLEALVGAVYHRSGGDKASRFFHAHILPTLLAETFPAGVPEDIQKLAEQRRAEADRFLA